jgi:hypothetical protein
MLTLSMRIVTYLIEYLGEFKFIFEIILDYESGDQMGSFDAKNPPSKISCLGTFKKMCEKMVRHIFSASFRCNQFSYLENFFILFFTTILIIWLRNLNHLVT